MPAEKAKIKQLDNGNYLNERGEEIRASEYVNVLVPKKQKWTRGEYVMGLQNSFLEIAKYGLGGEELNVLLLLIAKTDFENYVNITQEELAKELGIKRPNVARALKILVQKEIIKKMKKGTSNFYLFNPEIIYKGQSKNYGNVVDLFKWGDNQGNKQTPAEAIKKDMEQE